MAETLFEGIQISTEELSKRIEKLHKEMVVTDFELSAMTEDEKRVCYLIDNFGFDTYFEGIIGLALLDKYTFSKYDYFFSYLLSNNELMKYIFLFYAYALIVNSLESDPEKSNQLIEKLKGGEYEVRDYFIKLLRKVYDLKRKNTITDIILKEIKKACTNYEFFSPYTNDSRIEKISKDPEAYVVRMIDFLKQASLLYVRHVIDNTIYFKKFGDEMMDDVAKTLYDIHSFVKLSNQSLEVEPTLDNYIHEKEKSLKSTIPTGLNILDGLHEYGSGYKKGTLTVVTGASGIGKSKFVTFLGSSAIKNKFNVVHIISENDMDEVMEDYYSTLLGKKFELTDAHEIKNKTEFIKHLRILKFKPKSFSPQNIRSHLIRMIYSGFMPDVLIIDSLNLMKDDSSSTSLFNKGENIIESLFDIAKEFDIALLCTLQFNRKGIRSSKGLTKVDDDNEDFEVSVGTGEDLSISYAILNYAHQFFTLNQNIAKEAPRNLMRLYIEKIRRGISNVIIPFYFDKRNMVVRELSKDELIHNYSDKLTSMYDKLLKLIEENKKYDFNTFKDKFFNILEDIQDISDEIKREDQNTIDNKVIFLEDKLEKKSQDKIEDKDDYKMPIVERILGISREELKKKDPILYFLFYDEDFMLKNYWKCEGFGINETRPLEEQKELWADLRKDLEKMGYKLETIDEETGEFKIIGRESLSQEECFKRIEKYKEEAIESYLKEGKIFGKDFNVSKEDIPLVEKVMKKLGILKEDQNNCSNTKNSNQTTNNNLSQNENNIDDDPVIGLVEDETDYSFEEDMKDLPKVKLSDEEKKKIENMVQNNPNIPDHLKEGIIEEMIEAEEDRRNGFVKMAEYERVTKKIHNEDSKFSNTNQQNNSIKKNKEQKNKSLAKNNSNNENKDDGEEKSYSYNIFDDLENTSVIAVIGNPVLKQNRLKIERGVLKPFTKQKSISKYFGERLGKRCVTTYIKMKNDLYLFYVPLNPPYINKEKYSEEELKKLVKPGKWKDVQNLDGKYISSACLKPNKEYLYKALKGLYYHLNKLNPNKKVYIVYDNIFKYYLPVDDVVSMLKEIGFDKLNYDIYLCNGFLIEIARKKESTQEEIKLIDKSCDYICIPVNGAIKKNGEAIMGAGVAKTLKNKIKDLPKLVGKYLSKSFEVHLIDEKFNLDNHEFNIIIFPSKPKYVKLKDENDFSKIISRVKNKYKIGDVVPGFYCKADKKIILKSCNELAELIDNKKIDGKIILPLPGAGNGELSEKESLELILNSLLMKYKDQIFIVTKKWKKSLRELEKEYKHLIKEDLKLDEKYNIFENLAKYDHIISFTHGYITRDNNYFTVGFLKHFIQKDVKAEYVLKKTIHKNKHIGVIKWTGFHIWPVISTPKFLPYLDGKDKIIPGMEDKVFRNIPGYMLKYDKNLMILGLNEVYDALHGKVDSYLRDFLKFTPEKDIKDSKIAIIYERWFDKMFSMEEFINDIVLKSKFGEIPENVYIIDGIKVKLSDYLENNIKKNNEPITDEDISYPDDFIISDQDNQDDVVVIDPSLEFSKDDDRQPQDVNYQNQISQAELNKVPVDYEKFEYPYRLNHINFDLIDKNLSNGLKNKIKKYLEDGIEEDKTLNISLNDMTKVSSYYSIYHWHKKDERHNQIQKLENILSKYIKNGHTIFRMKPYTIDEDLKDWSENKDYITLISNENLVESFEEFKTISNIDKIIGKKFLCLETGEVIKLI